MGSEREKEEGSDKNWRQKKRGGPGEEAAKLRGCVMNLS